MRIFFIFCLFSLLFITGCNTKESNLEVKIKDVSWKEETKNGNTSYKTIIVITDDRRLTFDGIHDFKVGNLYKIKVREHDAALLKFEPSQKRDKEEAVQTFKPTTNTTSDKIVFKVVVDKSGNILASEEVGPEVSKNTTTANAKNQEAKK